MKMTFKRSCGHSESAQFFGTLSLTERIKQESAALCEDCKKRQIANYQKKRLQQKT